MVGRDRDDSVYTVLGQRALYAKFARQAAGLLGHLLPIRSRIGDGRLFFGYRLPTGNLIVTYA